MREVFRSADFTEVGYYKTILDEQGIVSFIQNQNTGNPAMSGAAFSPTLCVMNDDDFDKAIRVLKERQASTSGPDWKCPACHETNPGNFDICWKCQAVRPAL
jgi:hypothetical protein